MRRSPQTTQQTQDRVVETLKLAVSPLTCTQLSNRGAGNYEAILKAVRALEGNGWIMSHGKAHKYGNPTRWALTLAGVNYPTRAAAV